MHSCKQYERLREHGGAFTHQRDGAFVGKKVAQAGCLPHQMLLADQAAIATSRPSRAPLIQNSIQAAG